MDERKVPDTSHAAFKSMQGEAITKNHAQIIKALKAITKGTFEDIAIYLKWVEKVRVSKRLSELERAGLVHKPGEKKKTLSGREAYVYLLTPTGYTASKKIIESVQPSPVDVASAIVARKKQHKINQDNQHKLFQNETDNTKPSSE